MNATAAQWIGCREHQEDAYAIKHLPDGVLAVVCDGMGGHSKGDLASKEASRAFERYFVASQKESVPERLRDALNAANDAVAKLFEGTDLMGGCTLTAVFVSGVRLWWISVGDSPLFLWRGNHLTRLNADHSMRPFYEGFAQKGIISYQDAMAQGHMLRSSLIGKSIPLIDAPQNPRVLLPNDRIYLASDGVDPVLPGQVLSLQARMALSSPFLNSASAVVEACRAVNDPCADNVTVVVLGK